MSPKRRDQERGRAVQDACSCGLASAAECQALFDAMLEKEFSDPGFSRVHRLTVDAYSLQHPERYTASVKSFAAHLTGMCCAIEHGGDPVLLRTLQQWLGGTRDDLNKPPLPHRFGGLTIAHPAAARNAAEHAARVQEWAAGVWKAYAIHHELARAWIADAKRRRPKR